MKLAEQFDGFLIDLDGVIWRGDDRIEGAAETILELRDAGKRVVFLTNNASMSPREYAAKLMRHRIPTQPGDIVSSAHAIVDYLKRDLRLSRGDRVHLCGTTGLGQVLRGAGLIPSDAPDVGAVVVAWNPKLTFEDVRRAADLARAGVPLIAANRDATYPAGDGLLPGTGSIIAAIETASGVSAHAVGKPEPPLFRFALDHAGTETSRTLVCGDRLETDIAGARQAGLASALVLTGVATLADLETTTIDPDWVLDRIDDLVREGARPWRARESEAAGEQVAVRTPPSAERDDQDEAGEKPADVGEEGDAGGLLRGVAAEGGQQLADEPQADDDVGRRAQREEEEAERDERDDAGARPQQDVRAEESRDRSRRADHGVGGVRVREDEQQRRGDPADDVEEQKTYTTESIFDVVPEDPQEEHVEPEMQDVGVHEHRREQVADRGPLVDEDLDFLGEGRTVPDEVAWDQSVPVDDGA